MFLLLAAIIIGLLWILQAYFFNDYYQNQKLNQMKRYGIQLEEQIKTEGLSQETQAQIEEIGNILNGRITVIDTKGRSVYQNGFMMGAARAFRIPSDVWRQAQRGETVIYRIPGHTGFIDTLALLMPINDYYLLLQTPLQVIEESVSISQQFYVYLFFVALIVSMLLSGIFSRTITGPLVKLNRVAGEMAKLNFDVRWEDNRGDEIGQLGETINFLTDQLKKSFDELKLELMKEKNMDKMRKQFVARVSHELQTPISLLRGYTEALQDNMAKDKNEEIEYYQIIDEEIDKLSHMVKDLLDLSQLESGSFKVKMESFEISSLIDGILHKFRMLYKNEGIQFHMKDEDAAYNVLGDEYRIEQVITNLLQNAVAHCPVSGNIIINLENVNEVVRIEVYNEGEPIHKDDIDNIWESFYTGNDEGKGTGLGLAIVKSVLELHDSNYGVENIDDGVVFYFYLNKAPINL